MPQQPTEQGQQSSLRWLILQAGIKAVKTAGDNLREDLEKFSLEQKQGSSKGGNAGAQGTQGGGESSAAGANGDGGKSSLGTVESITLQYKVGEYSNLSQIVTGIEKTMKETIFNAARNAN